MKTYINNGTVLTPEQRIEGATVIIENGKIIEISSLLPSGQEGNIQIDAEGSYVCPGFIDIHFHGALGKDTMDADEASLQLLSIYCADHGVTSFYPTTWSASPEDILRAIEVVKINQKSLRGAQALGVHIEGPFIDLEFRGAQLQSMIRPPVKKEYENWINSGVVKVITCAPELEGSEEFIKEAVQNKIRISIGHSQAKYDQVKKAADIGATQATHIFNGMLGLHHREPGTVGGILTDKRIYAQVICDGVHLHPAIVQLIVNAKTASKVILISDSIRGAGLPDGDYDHKGQKFSVRGGVARTPEGVLSGSTLTLDSAVRNALDFTESRLEEVISMVTSVPAEAMGILNAKGKIAQGYDADLVILNKDLHVEKTIVNGNVVFSR